MKVTQAMIEAFGETLERVPRREIEEGIQAVLDLIMPDTSRLEYQRVYIDGDMVTVIDQQERPELAHMLTIGQAYRIAVEPRPIPAERAQ